MGGYSIAGDKQHTSPHKIFTRWKDQISGEVYIELLRQRLSLLMRSTIFTINELVAAYDSSAADYYSCFFNTLERKCGCKFDIFNLNYDTWPQQVLTEYNDGFSEDIFQKDGTRYPFKRFHPEVYLSNDDINHIANMHGCILYGLPDFRVEDGNRYAYDEPFRSMYKYDSYKAAEDYRKRSFYSDSSTQSGESYYTSNIITGLMKPDKVVESPLNTYLHGFYKALEQNEKLIVIGYGFSDIYINAALDMYLQAHRENHKSVIGYVEKKKWNPRIDNSFLGNGVYFLSRLFRNQRWYITERKDLIVSDDKMTCYCPMGFKSMKAEKRLKKVCRFFDE